MAPQHLRTCFAAHRRRYSRALELLLTAVTAPTLVLNAITASGRAAGCAEVRIAVCLVFL